MKRIGLIVNPIAGLGGRVGLKGSDGLDIQLKALELGALPHAGERAALALKSLLPIKSRFELLACPSEMGEKSAKQAGIQPHLVGTLQSGSTTAEDTIRAARTMIDNEVSLILFAGGDGTARDIYHAIGMDVLALGIPAGVKIHSAVFATSPSAAGELASAFLRGETELRSAEVMDLDEDAFRLGQVSPRLVGSLMIPWMQRYIQGGKAPSPLGESAVLEAIAAELALLMKPGWVYIFGPGSTTQSVARHLGLYKTLLGVDAALDGQIILPDASENGLLGLLSEDHQAEIIVTPIGGQGCLFGRGNQPISPAVIRKVGRKHIRVVSTPAKIQALYGCPLWVDTGDSLLDEMLGGYFEIITGCKESLMYKVKA
jgi:predicted polyphosphate/ATP-dependent NAD kinase